jgi:hypothetical protein
MNFYRYEGAERKRFRQWLQDSFAAEGTADIPDN